MKQRYYGVVAGLLAVGQPAVAQSLDFGPVTTYPANSPLGVAVGDVTGDGLPDLVVTNSGSTLGVLPGLGSGSFGAMTTYPAGGWPQSVKLGDLNNDGKPDVVVGNGTNVGVLLNLGGGLLGPVTTYPAAMTYQPNSLAVADLNRDGQLDVVTALGSSTTSGSSSAAYVLLGQGNGTLGTAAVYPVGSGTMPESVAVGDVTDDGIPDVVVAIGGYGQVAVLPGTGTGSLGAARLLGSGGTPWLALGDVNADGRLDIVAGSYAAGGFTTFLNRGGGSLLPSPAFSTPQNGTCPVLADVNGDGYPDLVATLFGGTTVAVVPGSSGGFGPASSFSTGPGSSPFGLAVADLSGDTLPDLVVANYGTNTAGVLLNGLPALLVGNPGSGSAGSSLTLRGQGLAGTTSVTFTSAAGSSTAVAAASFTATSYATTPQAITLPVPATLAAGTYAVRAITPRGSTNAHRFQVTTATLATAEPTPAAGLSLAPNPGSRATTLTFPTPTGARQAHIQLFDGQGRVVLARSVAAAAPLLTLLLPLDGLAPGLYQVVLNTAGQRFTHRLAVE